MLRQIRRGFVVFVMLQFLTVSGLLPAARAAMVPTSSLLSSQQTDQTRARLQAMVARDDVRAKLVQMGVDPNLVDKRVAELTPAELHQLQGKMNKLPAGGDGVLAVLGVVFLVLIILELVGVTHVFSRF